MVAVSPGVWLKEGWQIRSGPWRWRTGSCPWIDPGLGPRDGVGVEGGEGGLGLAILYVLEAEEEREQLDQQVWEEGQAEVEPGEDQVEGLDKVGEAETRGQRN